MNNLTHAQRTTLTSHTHTHTCTLARNVGQHLLARHFDNLWLFAFDLHCPKRHAAAVAAPANYNAYAPGHDDNNNNNTTIYSMHCSVYPCGVPNDWRTALRRPINFRHVTANYTFSIFAPHTFYLSFLFCAASLSLTIPLSLALSHAVAETTNQPGKTATIEMYAPSSYNDTVTGETLSSVSEKSESYSNEGSQPEYIVSIHTHKHTHIH